METRKIIFSILLIFLSGSFAEANLACFKNHAELQALGRNNLIPQAFASLLRTGKSTYVSERPVERRRGQTTLQTSFEVGLYVLPPPETKMFFFKSHDNLQSTGPVSIRDEIRQICFDNGRLYIREERVGCGPERDIERTIEPLADCRRACERIEEPRPGCSSLICEQQKCNERCLARRESFLTGLPPCWMKGTYTSAPSIKLARFDDHNFIPLSAGQKPMYDTKYPAAVVTPQTGSQQNCRSTQSQVCTQAGGWCTCTNR